MAKIKYRVALIYQTPRAGADGGPSQMTTNVKLTPINLVGGDQVLAFARADVFYHPEHTLRDPKQERNVVKTMIPANSLITRAVCYTNDGEACTFDAAAPAHPGHPDMGINPSAEKPAQIIEVDYP